MTEYEINIAFYIKNQISTKVTRLLDYWLYFQFIIMQFFRQEKKVLNSITTLA